MVKTERCRNVMANVSPLKIARSPHFGLNLSPYTTQIILILGVCVKDFVGEFRRYSNLLFFSLLEAPHFYAAGSVDDAIARNDAKAGGHP